VRAFDFDAFVSHNRDDGAAALSTDLTNRGVAVYCDQNDDLTDRQVRTKVGRALARSRFVLVHVGPNFRLSSWCRAEIMPSFQIQSPRSVERVLVGRSPGVIVPGELAACSRVFTVPSELEDLARFVITANRVPDLLAIEIGRQNALVKEELERLQRVRSVHPAQFDDVEWDEFRILQALARSFEKLALAERISDTALSATCGHLARFLAEPRQIASRRDVTVDRDEFASRVQDWMSSLDHDLQFNVKSLLLSLAKLLPDIVDSRTAAEAIASEIDAFSVRRLLWQWVKCSPPSGPSIDLVLLASLTRAAKVGVRFHRDFESLITELPDCARIRATFSWPSLDTLPFHEHALLLRQRLNWLDQADSSIGEVALEIEGELREVLGEGWDVDLTAAAWGEVDQECLGRNLERRAEIVATLEELIDWAERSGYGGDFSGGLVDFASLNWMDYVLLPLTCLTGLSDATVDELRVFDRACSLIETNDSEPYVVPVCRAVAARLRTGDDSSVVWNLARLKMLTLSLHYRHWSALRSLQSIRFEDFLEHLSVDPSSLE
jgi:hypothetical protein